MVESIPDNFLSNKPGLIKSVILNFFRKSFSWMMVIEE